MSIRFLPPILVSASITFLLFWIMTALIAVPEISVDPPAIAVTHIVEVMRAEDPPPPQPKLPVRPPPYEQPVIQDNLLDPSEVTVTIPGPVLRRAKTLKPALGFSAPAETAMRFRSCALRRTIHSAHWRAASKAASSYNSRSIRRVE